MDSWDFTYAVCAPRHSSLVLLLRALYSNASHELHAPKDFLSMLFGEGHNDDIEVHGKWVELFLLFSLILEFRVSQ